MKYSNSTEKKYNSFTRPYKIFLVLLIFSYFFSRLYNKKKEIDNREFTSHN